LTVKKTISIYESAPEEVKQQIRQETNAYADAQIASMMAPLLEKLKEIEIEAVQVAPPKPEKVKMGFIYKETRKNKPWKK
jgi:hypothetical protein